MEAYYTESYTHTEKQILKKRAIVFSDSRFCHTQSQGPYLSLSMSGLTTRGSISAVEVKK